jgi:GT2 family glycosyltransferase
VYSGETRRQPLRPAVDLSRVGLAIVTYESATTIAPCLDSFPLDRLGRVVVVDHGSRDETLGVLAGYSDRVDVIQAPANRGFAAGVNRAVAALDGFPYIAVANPDVVASAGALDLLVAVLDDDDDVAVVGPTLTDVAGRVRRDVRRFSTPLTELRWLLPGKTQRLWLGPRRRLSRWHSVHKNGGDVAYVQGACFVARAAAWVQGGGLDERLFLYCEEEMLCRRLWSLGWRVAYVPAARVAHVGGVSTATAPEGARHHLFASTYLLLRSWYGTGGAETYARLARLAWAVSPAAHRLHRETLAATRARVTVGHQPWAVAHLKEGRVQVQQSGRCVVARGPREPVDPRSWPASPCHAVTTRRIGWRAPRDLGSVREPLASVTETWPPAPRGGC